MGEPITEKDQLELIIDACPSGESLELVESVATPHGEFTGVVLATLDGPCMDYAVDTRNGRLYEEDLCDEIHNSDYVRELIETKNFLGEPDHPMRYQNRLDIHYPYVSHAIRNFRKVPEKRQYYATFDILDTPNGRILKTLIDYGVKLGVSSRGSGRTINKNGRVVVDKRTYRFITFDIVNMPGNKVARLPGIQESTQTNLVEQVSALVESRDVDSLKAIKPVLNFLGENQDLGDLLNRVDEAISAEESNTITKSASDDLLEAYSTIRSLRAEVESRDSVINELNENLAKLNDDNQKLQNTSSELKESLDHSMELAKSHLVKEHHTRKLLESMQLKVDSLLEENRSLQESLNEDNKALANNKKLVDTLRQDLENEFSKHAQQISDLQESLDQSRQSLDSVTDQLNEYTQRYLESVSSYLKVRCSQLGLNESVVKKSINYDLNSYTISELEELIQESYRRKSNTNKINSNLMESWNKKVKVSGSMIQHSADSALNESMTLEQSELDSMTQLCKSVRNK